METLIKILIVLLVIGIAIIMPMQLILLALFIMGIIYLATK
jgi:hypothetical protein